MDVLHCGVESVESVERVDTTEMALLRSLNLQMIQKFLSSSIQPQAIAQANEKVRKAMKSMPRKVDFINCMVQTHKLNCQIR